MAPTAPRSGCWLSWLLQDSEKPLAPSMKSLRDWALCRSGKLRCLQAGIAVRAQPRETRAPEPDHCSAQQPNAEAAHSDPGEHSPPECRVGVEKSADHSEERIGGTNEASRTDGDCAEQEEAEETLREPAERARSPAAGGADERLPRDGWDPSKELNLDRVDFEFCFLPAPRAAAPSEPEEPEADRIVRVDVHAPTSASAARTARSAAMPRRCSPWSSRRPSARSPRRNRRRRCPEPRRRAPPG